MKPPLFSCLSSRIANNGSLYGRFLLGPLPIDISLTVATVLRRSLLHSQATFSIVSAEIEGATHEYASLPGIQESVLEILLNLGEIVLTTSQRNFINPNFRTKIGTAGFYFAFIRVTGPGIVTSKDINWPKGIFCVKPNIVICTLSSNETLTMRLKIACSLNKNKQSLVEIEENIKSITSTGINKNFTNSKVPKINKKAFPDLENQDKEITFNSYNSPDGSFEGSNDSVLSVTSKRDSKSLASFAFFSPLTLSGKDENGEKKPIKGLGDFKQSLESQNSRELTWTTLGPSYEATRTSRWTRDPSGPLVGLKAMNATTDENGSTIPYKRKDKFLINNQNQFNFFKFNKIKQSSTLLTSLKSSEINLKLNAKHFKRIKKKILLLTKTFLSEGIKSRMTFLEDQRNETKKLVNEFPLKKAEEETINSYSYRKQKRRLSFFLGTNEQSIFTENTNQSKTNVINISNKNDENNVTFRVFPGLFNDFLEASIKKQINQNEEIKNKELEIQRLWLSNKNNKANFFPTNQNSTYENRAILSIYDKNLITHSQSSKGLETIGSNQVTQGAELKNISTDKELEKQKTSLEVPKIKHQQRRKHELLVSNSSYPVEKVNFLIERDDELAGYRHRIILEVWTNGSISPRQAIFESIGSIIKLIYNFREPLRTHFN